MSEGLDTIKAKMDAPYIALSQALVEVQGSLQPIRKDAVNPQFKSKYATLDAIVEELQPHLHKSGLACIFLPKFEGDTAGVSLTIHHKDGGSLDCGSLMLPLGRSGGAQGAGSSLTYARRYMLCSVFNLALDDDDDDGNNATKHKPTQQAQKPAPRKDVISDAQCQALSLAFQELCSNDDDGMPKVKALLAKFGVKKAMDLPADAYDKAVEELEKIQN